MPSSQPNILLVDDDPVTIGVLGSVLQGAGQLRFATSGAEALRLARHQTPDLVLLDVDMPGMTGFEVCSTMKDAPDLADVPVIFITSHGSPEHEVTGLELGASDFVTKPLRAPLVLARVRMHLRVKQMADALRSAAYIDGLTGVANRRQFDAALERESARARRARAALSLLMIDIDMFKKYNDHYGHQAGDRCLIAVAQALRAEVHRPADLVARYGGEEFVVLLPDTDAEGACFLARQLLRTIEALNISHEASLVAGCVTLSIGVSTSPALDDGGSPADSRLGGLQTPAAGADLLAAADQALYRAKEGGRRQARFLSVDEVGLPDRATRVSGPPSERAVLRAVVR